MEPTACFMVEGVWDAFTDDPAPLDYRVGAMWWRTHSQPVGPNDTNPRPMPHLAVMTPAGMACLDCPASGPPAGRYWQREGKPPVVTVTPSLDIKGSRPWHGWVTDGVVWGG